MWSALHLAAWSGLTSVSGSLLKYPSIDVDLRGPSNSTALTLAAQKGHIDIVRLLLQAQCDVYATAEVSKSVMN